MGRMSFPGAYAPGYITGMPLALNSFQGLKPLAKFGCPPGHKILMRLIRGVDSASQGQPQKLFSIILRWKLFFLPDRCRRAIAAVSLGIGPCFANGEARGIDLLRSW